MLSSHVVASLVLAGLSMAHPQHYRTAPAPVQANTSDPAKLFPIVPTGTVTSINHHISSTAQLSKRQDLLSDDGDWDDVAEGGIGEIGEIAKGIFDIFGPHEKETESRTITVTQEPGQTSAPGETITTIVTSITAPGKTITTTVVPTAVVPKPKPTGGIFWPIPGKPGCSPEDKDCGEDSRA